MLKKPIERQRVFHAPKEKLWNIIIKGLLEEGEIINFTDMVSGIINIEYHITTNEANKYIIGDAFGATGGVAIVNMGLQSIDENKTEVYVNAKVSMNIVNQYGFSAGVRNYISNGKLEEKYLNLVSARLPEGKKYEWLNEEKTKGK
jgi:hypothetical protein